MQSVALRTPRPPPVLPVPSVTSPLIVVREIVTTRFKIREFSKIFKFVKMHVLKRCPWS